MTDFYIGYIGINPNDFWTNTFKENKLLSEAYVNEKNVIWEQTRFLATMIHNVQCTKKSQMVKPQDLFKLPQDNIKQQIAPPSTKEEFEKFKKLVDSKLYKK